MYIIIHKDGQSWFDEPIVATEVNPAKDWEVSEFDTYEEALVFIQGLV